MYWPTNTNTTLSREREESKIAVNQNKITHDAIIGFLETILQYILE